MTADRPTTEPRTEAGKRTVVAMWHLTDLTDDVLAIEAEAAQGAAPLDPERLARAIALHREQSSAKGQGCDHNCSPGITEMYERLSEGAAPRTEGLPELLACAVGADPRGAHTHVIDVRDDVRTVIESFRYSEPLVKGTLPHEMWKRNEETLDAILARLSRSSDERVPKP